jgi:lipid-binding SYLF domain-containing protein
MPERQVPRAVLRDARGLAIMRVVKVGFVFSGKGGDGVVIARTRQRVVRTVVYWNRRRGLGFANRGAGHRFRFHSK